MIRSACSGRPGVGIREGVDQDINYLLTQKEQPLSVINMVGGNFSDESLKGISRLPLAVWFVTDVDLSNVGGNDNEQVEVR